MTHHPEIFFTRFERFWHWGQALLILLLIVTGFHVTGLLEWLDYEFSARWHRIIALILIFLWSFTIFWHLITGEWRQYLPTSEKMLEVFHYYSKGIFDPSLVHPFKKTKRRKHNPLQRIAYLVLNVFIGPVLLITGFLFAEYKRWHFVGIPSDWLATVAGLHTAMAYAMVCFFLLHVYMAFTGNPVMAAVKAMITGRVEVDDFVLDTQREYKLLVVEDDPIIALMIQGWLDGKEVREGESILPVRFSVTHVENLLNAQKVLDTDGFDLILLDLSLPDSEGMDTFRSVKNNAEDVPILVINETEDEELQSRVVHEGAQDFLVKKNLSRRILLRAFRFALERHWFSRMQ
ncbi:MAG: Response regulatory protein [Magnetococcales bacterium]|nr:Response regulatory protein [Magnetococcales bacterium]HIJ83957.1 response regulator [Magnetococcales bacterium]